MTRRRPADERCPNCGRAGQVWPRPRIIEAAQLWDDATGKPPTCSQWRKASPSHPTYSTVVDVFGSWNDMLVEAGLPLRRKSPKTTWTKQDCVDAIFRFRYDHGRLPRFQDLLVATVDRPCSHTMVRLFGSWHAVIEAAGYVGEEVPA